jgi:hypothetical protein
MRHSCAGRLRQMVRSSLYNTTLKTVIQPSKSVMVVPADGLWLQRRATMGYIMKQNRPPISIMFHFRLTATPSRLLGPSAQERSVQSYTIDSHCYLTRFRGFVNHSPDKFSAVYRITRIFTLNRFSFDGFGALGGSIYYICTVGGVRNGLEDLFIRRRPS